MTKTYYPVRDSVPDKTMARMREMGRGMKAAEISAHTGYENKNVGNILQSAVTHGVLLKIGKGRSTYWCLPEHTGPEFVPPGNPVASDAPDGHAVERAQDGATPPAMDALEIAVWHDGDVIVKGGIEVEAHNGGKAMAYNHAQIAQLVRMMTQPTVAVA